MEKDEKTGARGKLKRAPERAPERVSMTPVRTLGGERARRPKAVPARDKAAVALAAKARRTLEQEFDRVLEMKEKMAAEARAGGAEKDRSPPEQEAKLRSLIASLEGMNRFALAMGMITPAESRELYAGAIKRGLYEGWRR